MPSNNDSSKKAAWFKSYMKKVKFSINESSFTFCIRRGTKGRKIIDIDLNTRYPNFTNDFVQISVTNYLFGQIIPTILHIYLTRNYENNYQ